MTKPLMVQPTTTYAEIVGQVIRLVRRHRGTTQADLAGAVGVGQPAWSKVERGATAINIEQLAVTAGHLDLEPNRVLFLADQVMDAAREMGVEVLFHREVAAGLLRVDTGHLVARVLHELR